MRILIDTNVILDALTHRAPFYEAAEQIILLAAERKVFIFLTANSIIDIYYLLRKHLQNPIEAKKNLTKLFLLFNILDVTGNDCHQALESCISDYEDALMSVCAKRNKMDCIITRNIKDFKDSLVQAILPIDFLESFREQN